MRKNSITTIILFLCCTIAWGSNGLRLSGKLRVIKPVTLQVKDMNGNVILSCTIERDGVFSTDEQAIPPDIYKLCIGRTEQYLFLENTFVTINGYFDEKNPKLSSLVFTGIDTFLSLQELLPAEPDQDKRIIPSTVKQKLNPYTASALAYLANATDYASNTMLLELIPIEQRNSLSAQWLIKWVATLSLRQIGAIAPDFTCTDANGKEVSLKDFRGKIVVLDFCASWCSPCRNEMHNMLQIYNELKANDLEFISVSLDDSEVKWRDMLKEENLPWVMLWDKEGFPKSSQTPNKIQTAYGFYSIPFLVVIDKDGKLIARKVRGEEVREVILKARQ